MTDQSNLEALGELIDIMATLRAPDGCRWDRQQTPASLKPYILEEAYELLEAIDKGNHEEICDELGDLLLQVVFQAQIFTEAGRFTIANVANSISSKLRRRHPHIFASADYTGHQQRWEEIKLQERAARGQSNKIADRISKTLPALKRAGKALNRCSTTETYNSIPKVIDKLEELQKTLIANPTETNPATDQIGQILLCVSAVAQELGVDPEDSLRCATNKMIDKIDKQEDLP